MANSGSDFFTSTTGIIVEVAGGVILSVIACIIYYRCRMRNGAETQPLLSASPAPTNTAYVNTGSAAPVVSGAAYVSAPDAVTVDVAPSSPSKKTEVGPSSTVVSLQSPPPPPPPVSEATSSPEKKGTVPPVATPAKAAGLFVAPSPSIVIHTKPVIDSADILLELNKYLKQIDEKFFHTEAKTVCDKLSSELETTNKPKKQIEYIDSCIRNLLSKLLQGDSRYQRFGCAVFVSTSRPDVAESSTALGTNIKAAYVRYQNELWYLNAKEIGSKSGYIKTDSEVLKKFDSAVNLPRNNPFLSPEELCQIAHIIGHNHVVHQYHAALLSARQKIKVAFNMENTPLPTPAGSRSVSRRPSVIS